MRIGSSFLFLVSVSSACGADDASGATQSTTAATAATSEPGTDGSEGGSDDTAGVPACFEPTHASRCDPMSATFTLDSTNPYYPLVVGNAAVLEGMDGSALIRIERTVLADTEEVAGVQTHVLEHREYVDDELIEVARNFYVEASDGTVCYFGEDVDNYADGMVINNNGSWRAGIDGAVPGIIMLADPMVGDAYYQELAPGIALDMGRVESVGTTETIGGTSYDAVLTVHDVNPLEDCDDPEPKLYVPGIGEAADVDVELIMFTPGG